MSNANARRSSTMRVILSQWKFATFPFRRSATRMYLLRVGAVSICGSDLHQWRGSHSWTVNYPCILGHEFAGTIAALVAGVKAFQEGDRVVSETAAVIDEAPLSAAAVFIISIPLAVASAMAWMGP